MHHVPDKNTCVGLEFQSAKYALAEKDHNVIAFKRTIIISN